jgi:tetratricopeptide (TPR) repeat protein/Ni/Co efflux regulator RcnB
VTARARRGIVAAALIAAAAIPLLAQSRAASDKLSSDWRRLSSDDIDVVGNASESELKRAFDRIQSFRSVLHAILPGIRIRSSERTLVYVFRDYGSFERFAPRDGRGRRLAGVGGYFFSNADSNVLALPVFETSEATYQTAFHEYTHYLIDKNNVSSPRWLNEGLADFYSTIEMDSKDKVTIGVVHAGRLRTLRSRSMPPVRRLLNGDSALRLFVGGDTELFYAHAWIFVHYMILGEDGRRGQLSKYLQLLRSSASNEEAASQAFGSLEDLDRDLRAYSRRMMFPALLFNGSFVRAAGSAVQPMLEADALALQGELLANLGDAAAAEKPLEKALTLAPRHLKARLALGRVRVLQERADDGITLLNGVADETPADFAAHFHLASALRKADRFTDSLKEFERARSLNDGSADAWFGGSLVALSMNRDTESEAALRQVFLLDPKPGWYYSHARTALGAGRYELAVRDVRRFLELSGWADESGPYAAFVAVIAHWRLGQKAEADSLLQQAAAAVNPKSWVASVTQYLQGTIADDEILSRAKDGGQRTEAHTYAGMKMLLAGQTDAAVTHFKWVKERGERNYTEHGMALAELKRLEQAR